MDWGRRKRHMDDPSPDGRPASPSRDGGCLRRLRLGVPKRDYAVGLGVFELLRVHDEEDHGRRPEQGEVS